MSIPESEWIAQAKRCAINQSRRVQHNREAGSDMAVGNKADRYWAYCHRCKEGGVSMKTHVVLSNKVPPASADLSLPADKVHVLTSEPHIKHGVGTFLASKHMDLEYLPAETFFSESRKRLMICVNGQWMGRDTTGRSEQKWLTYNQQSFVALPGLYSHNKRAILTEDLFSMFKVGHALRNGPDEDHHNTAVFCTLGTKINPPLFLRLIQEFSLVLSFYDGDTAGWHGCESNSKRLNALSIGLPATVVTQCAPRGMDPKDMSLAAIRQHVTTSFSPRGY